MENLENILATHHRDAFTQEKLKKASEEFSRNGYLKFDIGELVPQKVFDSIIEESNSLLEHYSIRRDVKVASTGYSKRYMSNVTAQGIRDHGVIIDALYKSPAMRGLLGKIAGDELANCWEEEHYLINKLEREGDTHGWHWGDYPYTVIWILEAPSIKHGGILQCIPHTTWDKKNPEIENYIIERPISSYYHTTGQAYFLKSDTTLHRVTPMKGEEIRIILNTCWASANDKRENVEHETIVAAFI
jgi:hypothetical protein